MSDEIQNSTNQPNSSTNKRRRASCDYCGSVGHTCQTCSNYLFRSPYAELPQTQNSSNVPVIEPVVIFAEVDELGNLVNKLDLEEENPNNLPAEFLLDVDNDDDSTDIDELEMDDDVEWTPFQVKEIPPEETGFPGNALPSAHNDTSGKPRNIPPDTRSCCQFLELLFSNEMKVYLHQRQTQMQML
jgi:hypothetical protein